MLQCVLPVCVSRVHSLGYAGTKPACFRSHSGRFLGTPRAYISQYLTKHPRNLAPVSALQESRFQGKILKKKCVQNNLTRKMPLSQQKPHDSYWYPTAITLEEIKA